MEDIMGEKTLFIIAAHKEIGKNKYKRYAYNIYEDHSKALRKEI